MSARGSARAARPGMVSLVGAGPGDPGLLTLRAIDRLAAADLVLYDGLVPRQIRELSGRTAERVSVARRVGQKALAHADVIGMMIAGARDGRRVVRLKSGDPFVFGRGGEEAEALADAGIPFEVVPGVTTAFAAPALAGIPVTHRGVASAVVVVSGHAAEGYRPVLESLAPGAATIVVLMGLGERRHIGAWLVERGWRPETPAALVVNASRMSQRVWTGTLAGLGTREDEWATREEPGVIVIGDVVLHARPGQTGHVSTSRRPRRQRND